MVVMGRLRLNSDPLLDSSPLEDIGIEVGGMLREATTSLLVPSATTLNVDAIGEGVWWEEASKSSFQIGD